jgi:hypothetical protein
MLNIIKNTYFYIKMHKIKKSQFFTIKMHKLLKIYIV